MGHLVRRGIVLVIGGFVAPSVIAQPEEQVIPSDGITTFVYIRAEPRASSAERGRLQIGQSLPIVGTVPRCYEVQLPDGTTGFVTTSWTRAAEPVMQERLINWGYAICDAALGRARIQCTRVLQPTWLRMKIRRVNCSCKESWHRACSWRSSIKGVTSAQD